MRRLVLLALSALIAAPASSAPDCARATLPAEKAVCSDPASMDLAAAERRMREAYKSLGETEGADLRELKLSQTAWEKRRDACKTAACRLDATRKRISSLTEETETILFSQGEALRRAIREAYPEESASVAGCRHAVRSTTGGDRAQELTYCMRPHFSKAIRHADGTRELIVVYAGAASAITADSREETRRLLGMFVFAGEPGHLTFTAGRSAIPAGAGDRQALALTRLGPDRWGVTTRMRPAAGSKQRPATLVIWPDKRTIRTASVPLLGQSTAPDPTLPAQGGIWPWVATFPAAAAQSKTLFLPFDAENQRWTVPSGAALP